MSDRAEPHWKHNANQAVIKGRRIDHLIPSFLLDSPLSRIGYWWGTAVGMTWGFLFSRGTITTSEGLWVFRGLPAWAFPRGGVCVGRCFLTGPAAPSAAVLKHERVHMRQWQRYGFLMPLLYLFAGRNPLTNRFEIEAGLADGNYVPRHHRV